MDANINGFTVFNPDSYDSSGETRSLETESNLPTVDVIHANYF